MRQWWLPSEKGLTFFAKTLYFSTSTLLELVVEELEGFERDPKGIPLSMVLPKGSTTLGKKEAV